VERIYEAIPFGYVNQRRNRVDQGLGIQTLGSLSCGGHGGMIHPEKLRAAASPIVVREFA